MALAAATHHSAQPRAKEEVEGETNDAPRRPKPPLPGKRPASLVEVAEPQAKLGQHSGIGYELVLAPRCWCAACGGTAGGCSGARGRVGEEAGGGRGAEEMAPYASESARSPPAEEVFRTHFQAEEEEEEEEEASSDVLTFLFSPRSSSTTAVACSKHHGWYGPG